MLTFLLLMIVLLNVCLGVVLAVRLGVGPPTVRDAWDMFLEGGPPIWQRAERELPAELATMLQETGSSDLAMLEESSLEDLFEEVFEEAQEQPQDVRPVEETAQSETEGPEIWDLNEKYVETSILRLNVAMIKSGARATEIDTTLRSVRGKSDAETIQTCLRKLKEDCETYLKEQSEAAEKLHNRLGEFGELAALAEEIEFANMEQAAQIETTVNNLTHMDFESDLEEANVRLLGELSHLRLARHRLREGQDEAFLAVARYQDRLDKIEPKLFNDSLTKLYGRIGLEVTLDHWWKAGQLRSRQMNAAMVDLDGFTAINDHYGLLASDKILHQFARILEQQKGTGDLVGRFAGQRFLLVAVDVGPRAMIKKVEQLRQQFEKTTFLYAGQEIRLSLRAAVTEVKPDDAPAGLFKRLNDTLAAARKAGPNQAFEHDGRAVKPIEAPSLKTDPVEICL
ncbi:MAG: diguanylate cyclase [Pirellulales bacterium]|nr:diguanylate cyclase [Pirellulales bacterium]